jgi:lanosterol synthase
MSFWAKLQTDDGHWADDYGGPMFLLPGLFFSIRVSSVDEVMLSSSLQDSL